MEPQQTVTPSPYERELTVTRLVVMLEESAFNNKYFQIALNREQFIAISKIIWDSMPKKPNGEVTIMTVPRELIKLPDDLDMVYEWQKPI